MFVLKYLKKEDKLVEEIVAGLDISVLTHYIKTKAVFKTGLEAGKYNLALLLKNNITAQQEEKNINYLDLQKDFYIAATVNEYMEKPNDFKSFFGIADCFMNRSGMKQELIENKNFAKDEMSILFNFVKTKYETIEMPQTLPDYIKSGSGYAWGSCKLHLAIKNLFDQCQQKILEAEKKQSPVP